MRLASVEPERPSILPEASRPKLEERGPGWRGSYAEHFAERVARMPYQVAASFAGQQLTYAELNVRANRLAHHLQALGVGPESLVGVCLERSLDLLVALLAVWKAGGAYLPLDPDYPAARLAWM